VRSTSSGLSIYYHCSFGFFWIIFYPSPHYKALPFYLIISPVPTCLAHNCETSRRFAIPICCHPCLRSNSLWSPITAEMSGKNLNPQSIPTKLWLWSQQMDLMIGQWDFCQTFESLLESAISISRSRSLKVPHLKCFLDAHSLHLHKQAPDISSQVTLTSPYFQTVPRLSLYPLVHMFVLSWIFNNRWFY